MGFLLEDALRRGTGRPPPEGAQRCLLYTSDVYKRQAYLSPYRTADGQLVLVLVGCLYGIGLLLMARMVRQRPFPRLPIAATGAAS